MLISSACSGETPEESPREHRNSTFFPVIARLVDHSQLTLKEIARRSGVHISTVSGIYRGVDRPSFPVLYVIATLGLGLDAPMVSALERLRQMEPPKNHARPKQRQKTNRMY